MPQYLTLSSLLQVARAAVGGEVVVRDFGLLQSAIARPAASVFGADAYPTLTGKAAALLESLVRNHALVDGNKRTGWMACEVFLYINGVEVTATQDEKFDFVLSVASGVVGVEKSTEWLTTHTRPRTRR